MLKETVNYVDFDGNDVTEELYFNLTQTELVEMSMDLPDDITNAVGDGNNVDKEVAAAKIIEALGGKGVFEFVKQLLLKSYGRKTANGRGFEKSEELTKEFSQSLAFDAIFMELMSNDVKAAEFVNKIIPSNVLNKANERMTLPMNK